MVLYRIELMTQKTIREFKTSPRSRSEQSGIKVGQTGVLGRIVLEEMTVISLSHKINSETEMVRTLRMVILVDTCTD